MRYGGRAAAESRPKIAPPGSRSGGSPPHAGVASGKGCFIFPAVGLLLILASIHNYSLKNSFANS